MIDVADGDLRDKCVVLAVFKGLRMQNNSFTFQIVVSRCILFNIPSLNSLKYVHNDAAFYGYNLTL